MQKIQWFSYKHDHFVRQDRGDPFDEFRQAQEDTWSCKYQIDKMQSFFYWNTTFQTLNDINSFSEDTRTLFRTLHSKFHNIFTCRQKNEGQSSTSIY